MFKLTKSASPSWFLSIIICLFWWFYYYLFLIIWLTYFKNKFGNPILHGVDHRRFHLNTWLENRIKHFPYLPKRSYLNIKDVQANASQFSLGESFVSSVLRILFRSWEWLRLKFFDPAPSNRLSVLQWTSEWALSLVTPSSHPPTVSRLLMLMKMNNTLNLLL